MSTTAVARRPWAQVRSWLPAGRPLPTEVWALRHRWVVGVLLVQVVLLPLFGLWRGYSAGAAALAVLPAVVLAAAACWGGLGVRARSAAAALGVMTISTSLVHLGDGYVEAHFHVFVMIPVVALYQTWVPFGLAIGLVLAHHAVLATTAPATIVNHAAGQAHPWLWGAIHAAAIAAASVVAMVGWRVHERARDAEDALTEQLAFGVDHDALTGLPNRTAFMERLAQARLAGRRTQQAPVVLMLDLDGFKDVNDTMGHRCGDLVLVEVARRLWECLRPGDSLCRLGGDEFVVLVAEGGAEAGQLNAERVVSRLAEPYSLDGLSLDLEVSIGLADASGPEDGDTVLRHADAAMHVAKEQRLGWTHFDHDDHTVSARLGLIGELRRALADDEIVLHYQPKVSLDTGEVVGVEALARWQHPVRGMLQPADFVPVVERTNLNHPFTLYVLRRALDQAVTWRAAGVELPIAVNISSRCLRQDRLADVIIAEIALRGLPPGLLCLEITEDTLMTDPETSIATLRRVREYGVRVSLDDFGTGYSSMSYLRNLPLDELKIDRSFVRGLGDGPGRDEVLVRSVVDLAHNLALPVVAEGVEDVETQTVLRDMGCDTVQGYHLSRPMPGDAVTAWLTATLTTDPGPTRRVVPDEMVG